MKRVLLIFLSLCALSVSALAAEEAPPRWAFASDEEWQEAAAQSAATESSKPIECAGVESWFCGLYLFEL